MSELDDEQLDAMLQGFFARSLDPQKGRAEWSFRRYLKDTRQVAWRQRTWLLGAFVTGMAASIAMLWASPIFRVVTPGTSPSTNIVADSNGPQSDHPVSPTIVPSVERVVQSHTTDQGIMLFGDDTPIRVFRRQQLKQKQWLDSRQQIQAEQTTPQDELVFIKMPTY
jgi:hypothetical protein